MTRRTLGGERRNEGPSLPLRRRTRGYRESVWWNLSTKPWLFEEAVGAPRIVSVPVSEAHTLARTSPKRLAARLKGGKRPPCHEALELSQVVAADALEGTMIAIPLSVRMSLAVKNLTLLPLCSLAP